jgi:hypothetical protein
MKVLWVSFIAVLLTGCMANNSSTNAMEEKGNAKSSLLDAKLVVDQGQPNEVQFTLTVTNGRRTDYHGKWRDSRPARFWVTDELSVIWVDAPIDLPAEIRIDIPAGKSITYTATWSPIKMEALQRKKLTAHAVFLPEQLSADRAFGPKPRPLAMAAQGPTQKCNDAACRDFNRDVPADHQHWHRCNDAACRDFMQYVPPDHQHWHRCNDTSCRDFLQYVPPDHQHWHRCNSVTCQDSNQYVPPDHKHRPK